MRLARVGLMAALLSVLCMIAPRAADSGNPSSQQRQSLSTPIESGTLCLDGGIPRLAYWPVAFDGRMQAWMADGIFQARFFMTQHDGDWCRFKLRLEDGAVYVLDSLTTIVLVLGNGDSVMSTQILAPDGPFELQFWKATDSPLIFKNGACPYGRTFTAQEYMLYVRFPENSCLSDKLDESGRRFESRPVKVYVSKQE